MSDAYGAQPPAAPPAGAPDDLSKQWSSWMDNPQNKAALMQFGLALSQPVGLGQNTMGHIGQAIGAGGEAAHRVDTAQMANDEQDRKWSETDSKAESRINAATNAETRANAATSIAASTAAQVDSRINLRRAQALQAEARKGQLDAQVTMLEQRIAAFPEDAQARLELNQARTLRAQADTDLLIAKASVIPEDSQTRRQNADTRAADVTSKVGAREAAGSVAQQNADTRRDLGTRRTDIAQTKADTSATGISLSAGVRDRRAYDQYTRDTKANDNNALLMNPKAVPTPIPSFQEWRASRSTSPAAGGFPTPPAPAPAPASPAPAGTGKFFKIAPSDISKYPDAKQAPDGNYYVQR